MQLSAVILAMKVERFMDNSNNSSMRIREARRRLQNPYAFLNSEGGYDAVAIQENATEQLNNAVRQLLHPYAYINDAEYSVETKSKQSTVVTSDKNNIYAEIERKARDLQISIWKNRHQLWQEGVPSDPVELLNPSIAVQHIGYDYELAESLGDFRQEGKDIEVAGIIDPITKRISISRRLPHNTHRFTVAHELGHALLHSQSHQMHRDRAIDGSSPRRESTEVEADKFATYFLMPEKLVRKYFQEVFGVSPFILSEDTAFALNNKTPFELMSACKTTRDLSRVLAKAEYYNGTHVRSIASRFSVTVETMAIRLEELKLLESIG